MAAGYNESQLIAALGDATVAKGREYLAKVRELQQHDTVVTAMVQGTQRQPYLVEIGVRSKGAQLDIDGECSCPVGYNCKHVAAALLAVLARQAIPVAAGSNAVSLRPEVLAWLELLRIQAQQPAPGSGKKKATGTQGLVWAVGRSGLGNFHEVRAFKARLNADGSIRSVDEQWRNIEPAFAKPPAFVREADVAILRLLWSNRDKYYNALRLDGKSGAQAMQLLLESGRLLQQSFARHEQALPGLQVMQPGATRKGQLHWQAIAGDKLQPQLLTEPASTLILPCQPPWYLDSERGEAGPIDLPVGGQALAGLLACPPLTLAEAPLVSASLQDVLPGLPALPGADRQAVRQVDAAPRPVLQLDTVSIYAAHFGAYGSSKAGHFDLARVAFDYDGQRVPAESNKSLLTLPDGSLLQIRRHALQEQVCLQQLAQYGLQRVPVGRVYGPKPLPEGALFGLPDPDSWSGFVAEQLPRLRQAGWLIEMAQSFHFNFIDIDDFSAEIGEDGSGWFDLALGIRVDGENIPLVPLLGGLFRQDPRWLAPGGLQRIGDSEMIMLEGDGVRYRIAAARIKPIVATLVDLFSAGVAGDSLRLSRLEAARLDALADLQRWQFRGDDSLRQLAQQLQGKQQLPQVPPPAALRAELRPYQQQGLNWLQFLRAERLGGILADDMGLGKTLQTLAHLLVEKQAGRLDQPALIVLPTSLVYNWSSEAAKFTPALRVLDLHRAGRKALFEQIGAHDLILTTYPLIWRDDDELRKYQYHYLILDEAQTVKNAASKAAATVRKLQARHRLCLTGTPLENHLGELWSQFDFLLPGFLGGKQDFTRRWRTPIEKEGDAARRELLARRIKPFLLRRRKDEVATELPPKTEIVRSVELEGGQRDLYETVRVAMQQQVQQIIAERGLANSHIYLLDAMLKLRQVCCDPRLVNLPQAQQVAESAKLELLLTLLDELLEEGRRVLLFSQFTSMLDLIAAALQQRGCAYVTLRGDTADRETPVREFQSGQVPLFLISLKAGGVGLNLTAADTVIHYDPWWNPAAENQATDRAYRIGQDKPVFVYKLIVSGSIEEKILALQQRKALLAGAVLSGGKGDSAGFSASDLAALLEPID